MNQADSGRRFLEALQKRKAEGRIPVIPDIKCFSPKEGDLLRGRDPVQYALALEAAGAPVLSVVTEEKEFHGSLEMLRSVAAAVKVPVLRKDFVETEEDLLKTKAAGASAILLMYSCLGREKLTALYHKALSLGLMPFVETHTAEHLRYAAELRAELVGINNRDILRLERDDGTVAHAESLLAGIPEGAFCVVESGLRGGRDVRRAIRAGADGALVGTALLRASDAAAYYRALTRPCDLKVCGLMNASDAALCLSHHVDFLGFVTEYPVKVPWNISRGKAAELIRGVRETAGDSAGLCMVTGGTAGEVIARALYARPDYVQLHYKESLAETAEIAEKLAKEGIRVIRSIPPDPLSWGAMFDTAVPEEMAGKLRETKVETLLLDSRTADNAPAGGGKILDRPVQADERRERDGMTATLFAALKGTGKTVALGGGITAENARDVMERYRPDIIDVMTGVETAPGHKSEKLLEKLVESI